MQKSRLESKFVRHLFAVGVAALMLSGSQSVAFGADYKLGLALPSANLQYSHVDHMAKLIAEKSAGATTVRLYSQTLGGEREVLEGMQIGTIDMGLIGIGPMGNLDRKVLVFALPYMFDGWKHLERVLKADVTKRINETYLKNTGLRILGWMEQGFRETITVNKPITKLEDMKGVKLRMTEDDVLIRTFNLLGARPTVMPFGEAYTAMQTGLVEGMESTPSGINSMKFYEVTKYVTLTGHQHTMMAVLIRESLWQKLDEKTRKIFTDAVNSAVDLNYIETPKQQDSAYMELIRNSKAVFVPDLAPFKAAVQPLIQEWGKETGTTELIAEIKSIK